MLTLAPKRYKAGFVRSLETYSCIKSKKMSRTERKSKIDIITNVY